MAMARNRLEGRRVAILATDGVEQEELTRPRQALQDAGAATQVVAPHNEGITGWDHDHWGETIAVDQPLAHARVEDFDALLLPGGVLNPDQLRLDANAVAFVRAFAEAGKPIAAICHGPWLLVEADLVRGRAVTSWPSLRTDLANAGATWEDREVVVDRGLVTSRKPDDIPAFNEKMIAEFSAAVPATG